MGLKPFELLSVAQVQGSSVDFTVEVLTPINLTSEYGGLFDEGEEVSFYGGGVPSNWNPDQFALMKFGKVLFASNDGIHHSLFSAYGNLENSISLYKGSNNNIVCDLLYNGKLYSVEVSYTFSSGATIFIGLYLPDLGERLSLYIDTNSDGTLEAYSTAERIGVVYPTVSAGLFNLVDEDSGYRFNISGGLMNISSGTAYVALVTRDGLFSLIEEA